MNENERNKIRGLLFHKDVEYVKQGFVLLDALDATVKIRMELLSDFTHKNFSKSDLSGINLQHINLSLVRFENTDLADTRLDEAEFYRVIFKGSDLKRASLSKTLFDRCDFMNASFVDAILNKTDFTFARLAGVDF